MDSPTALSRKIVNRPSGLLVAETNNFLEETENEEDGKIILQEESSLPNTSKSTDNSSANLTSGFKNFKPEMDSKGNENCTALGGDNSSKDQPNKENRKFSIFGDKATSTDFEERQYSLVIGSAKETKALAEFERQTGDSLTEDQIMAFKEAFKLFDKNGGGSFNSQDLQDTLESVGIEVNRGEVQELMSKLDKDENGVIDFDEFLEAMTDQEMVMEVHGTLKEDYRPRRLKDLLCNALTLFIKKSALKEAREIVGYYVKKYRKVTGVSKKSPHVVEHYANVARLIGITDKQLIDQLNKIKISQNFGNGEFKNSPYAAPIKTSELRSVMSPERKVKTKKQQRKSSLSVDSDSQLTSKNHKNLLEKLLGNASSQSTPSSRTKLDANYFTQRPYKSCEGLPEKTRKPGWLAQRAKVYRVSINLSTSSQKIPIDKLPWIRNKVEEAKTKFNRSVSQEKRELNLKRFKELNNEKLQTEFAEHQFHNAYSAYSSAATSNRGAVSASQLRKAMKESNPTQKITRPSAPYPSMITDDNAPVNSQTC